MKRSFMLLLMIILFFGCAPKVVKKAETVFYPPPPAPPKLQFLRSITVEADLGKTRSSFDEFLLGKPKFEKIIGKAYDIGSIKGKIYILDRTINKILILDLVKKSIDFIADQRLGALQDPSGIWVTKDDVKYVADMKRKQVVAFDPDNRFLRSYGNKDLFDRPTDVAVYENLIYVCDMNKHQVFVLDKTSGELLSTIGKIGSKEGEFYKPTHLTVDGFGNLFVNDAFNFRVQKFDQSGNFMKSYGFLGDNVGAFARPKGLDVDKNGYLYVADAAFENVQIFDSYSGRLLLFMGGAGAAPGSMYLPAGVHIDDDNAAYFEQYADKDFKIEYLLYVGNYFGSNKLNVYGFGHWIGPPLAGVSN